MTSQPEPSRRADANRENAKLSTGPKTEAGKAASSKNAATHGLTASYAYVRNDAERAQFEALESAFESQMLPTGPVERFHFNRLMAAAWNLERCDRLESELRSQRWSDPLLASSDPDSQMLRNLDLYRRRNERTYQRELKNLREIQSETLFRTVSLGAAAADPANPTISILVSVQQLRQRLTTDECNNVRRINALEAVGKFKAKRSETGIARPAPAPAPAETPVPAPVHVINQNEQTKPTAAEVAGEIEDLLSHFEAGSCEKAAESVQPMRSAA